MVLRAELIQQIVQHILQNFGLETDAKWPGSGQSEFELLGKREKSISKNFSIFISCVRNPFGVPSFS